MGDRIRRKIHAIPFTLSNITLSPCHLLKIFVKENICVIMRAMTQDSSTALVNLWQQLRKPLELEMARGCTDSAIAGASIAVYARLWAQRMKPFGAEEGRFALSIAFGLREYRAMPLPERRRRVMAAIDLLRSREAAALSPAVAPARTRRTRAAVARAPRKKTATPPPPETDAALLPGGHELLEMPLPQLAPRAKWPATLAARLQLYTVRDLLYHIPRDWLAIRPIADVVDGERAAIVATVKQRGYARVTAAKKSTALYKYTLLVDDDSAEASITAFTSESDRGGLKKGWNPARLPFSPGQRIFALGRVERTGTLVDLRMEDIYEVAAADAAAFAPGMRVPLYPLTQGVYQSQLQRAVLRALEALGTAEAANAIIDPLPERVREQYRLLPLLGALQQLHRPSAPQQHELARQRLAFEEFLIPQLILARRRWDARHGAGVPVCDAKESLPELIGRLASVTLTPAQVRVLGEIEADLRSPRPMNRLLQGDVGSGKTLVAAGALAYAVRAGVQAAMMAPTEILAEQLFLVLSHLLEPLQIAPVLLTGSQPAAARREALAAIACGAAPIAVGTQALIQDGVRFHNLGLAVIDEQHRFGVAQRATLRGKGAAPNALIMTATPIPRTLSLTMYGDLDVSILDGLPPGRHPVETRWVSVQELDEAYAFLRAQIALGRQAYVLCPLVEQSELLQADAATEMAASLRKRFYDLHIGLLHGRMTPQEKDAAMEAFRSGDTHILACTTVIEVGVDVPNASVILVHNAEHFGLSQLHQLRGRVGRAHHQSYCLLISHPRFDPASDLDELPARRRLRIMLQQQDGFAIAEADLQIRGPGEYLGNRQSGLLDFKIGSLLRDVASLELARDAAQAIIADDPELHSPALAQLRLRVQRMIAASEQFEE